MFHVNGGVDDTSYANNSLLQRKIISMTWPIAKEAITNLCHHIFPVTTLTMADLGCSSSPNTLVIVSDFVKQVEEIRQKLHRKPLEYQILLNDLHGNDFNAIFRSLPSFLENLKTQIGADLSPCFFNGVPGSFYNRLFPSKSVHFFHSSNSLHWLSQVPEGIENNKGNIFVRSTSPKNVLESYYKQFRKDFSMFLKCRAEELVIDGHMVLTMLGRTTGENIWSKECSYNWELLNLALNSMVAEGIVKEEKVDSFNIPIYMPSVTEVEVEFFNEGSFAINHLEVSRIDWNCYDAESNSSNISIDNSYHFAKCTRSVTEPLLIRHFGEAIMEDLFHRYEKIVAVKMSEGKTQLTNLTISLTKIK